MGFEGVKALTFDVFGTVVDWRTSIIEEGEVWGGERGLEVDWVGFADAWRAGYGPAMKRVNEGKLPWTNIDGLHRMILEEVIGEFGIEMEEGEKAEWNRVWHRLKPWGDSLAGIERLRKKYIVASLSNGNVALLTNMAKNAGFAWDCVLSAELAGEYKPHTAVYEKAATLLGLETGEVMMVAAHGEDLAGARRAGMKTAFVRRATEYGPKQVNDLTAPEWVDLAAGDFLELADKLGC